MNFISQFNYGGGLLLCEMLFLYKFPKRRFFWLRFPLSAAVVLFWSRLIHNMPRSMTLRTFLAMVALIIITMAGMMFCYLASPNHVISACTAGVALQHIGYHLYRMLALLPVFASVGEADALLELGVLLVFVFLFWVLGGKRFANLEYFQDYNRVTGLAAVLVVFICIGISRFLRLAGTLNNYAVISTSLYAITCCVLALFVQYALRNLVRVRSEYVTFQRLAKTQALQYETSRENAQMLNMKYHDLKHKLVDLERSLPREEMDSMRELLDEYDQVYHTGLEALDIVLNEKSPLCRAKGISLTVMGNGALLGFMKTMDVYSLFGNILENAIEAVEGLEPEEKRVISIVIEDHGDAVYVNATNYMDTTLEIGEEGLPHTSKDVEPGYHGFGLLSVQHIAQGYGGSMRISAQDSCFSLSILLYPELPNDSSR